ncbi:Molecular chaperone (DnaJ superfamily) [Handroanthus impetiginosus]|uniref:Molecular chaperone (DnaJ superfamily) n=1 Tax=Handroanthus impetiginosus TaxID=429701 RepID=A0A2G9HLJ2_9LAMI|nr:Molecular chaperone (DnaJ superfamily) [Handroanthus impetiginosus]
MTNFTNFSTLHRLLCRHRRLIISIPTQFSSGQYANTVASSPNLLLFLYPNFSSKRWLSTNAEWGPPPEFAGLNAYDILGVSQTSSFEEIKASFRKLAKETHPDLAHSQINSPGDSKKFIQILAAFEILSDSTKRAHYDRHILSQKTFNKSSSKRDTVIFNYNSYSYPAKQMEVVEWLKWYRYTINDILSERRAISGSGYFDVLERDFYSAMHAAYYGPEIESMDLLPDCFEAEERSMHTTLEVLHLVSGRYLFGMVCLPNRYHELSHASTEKITSGLGSVQLADNVNRQLQSNAAKGQNFSKQSIHSDHPSSDAYRDLELHLSGRVVAVATRVPPKNLNVVKDEDEDSEDSQDQIHVYLTSCEESLHVGDLFSEDMSTDSSYGSRFPLGVIKGLGTTSEEGTCYVYNNTGKKTHMIMRHRTLLVCTISNPLSPQRKRRKEQKKKEKKKTNIVSS